MTWLLAQGSGDRAFIRWRWIGGHLDDIWQQTVEHLTLTGIAVGVGLAVSLLLAVVALRWRRLYAPIAAAGGILYTIPSIAAFALLVPFFGFSYLTAEIALVSYTILILVRNIVTGIDGVPDEVLEAATGMGYTGPRRFVGIELPLALPVIIAGIRVATVTTVGLVTVTALIGQGGLGKFILDGFRRSIIFPTAIFVGTVGSVVLAVVLDALLLGLERLLAPWQRRVAG
ncbi:MAG TPA: ABC transporter permease [Nitriliruptorales bacterium]|nr:ABC transporter permease [Nitriliruptorales bacterium]